VYVYNVEERGEIANGDGNGSSESVNIAEHGAESESVANSGSES
jgi:hypothetical protein